MDIKQVDVVWLWYYTETVHNSQILPCQDLAHNFCCRLDNELMLCSMYPLLQILQLVALLTLDLLRQDGTATVDLGDDIVNHETRPVILQLAILEVLVLSLNGACAIILSYKSNNVNHLVLENRKRV